MDNGQLDFDKADALTFGADDHNSSGRSQLDFEKGDALTFSAENNVTAARAGVMTSANADADYEAHIKAVAQRNGVPIGTVREHPEEMKTQDKLGAINFDELATKNPVTTSTIGNFDKAKIVHDDITNMSHMENAISFLKGSAQAGGNELLSAGAQLVDTFNPFGLSDEDAAILYQHEPAKLQAMRDNSNTMALSRYARERTDAATKNMADISPGAKEQYESLKYDTTDTSEAAWASPVRLLGDVVRSLPTTAALAVTTYLTHGAGKTAYKQAIDSGLTKAAAKKAAISAATNVATKVGAVSEGSIGYAQQYSQTQDKIEKTPFYELATQSPEFGDLVAKGYDENAIRVFLAARGGFQSGAGAGIIDAYANKWGGKYLGKIIGEGGKLAPRVAKGFATEAIVEGVQSPGEQVAANAAIKNTINPNQDLSEGVLASTIQGFMIGGITGGFFTGAIGDNKKVESAERAALNIEQLNKVVAASKVLQRDPTIIHDFATEVSDNGPVQNLYINAETLMQSGVAQKLSELLPSITEENIAEALATGGEIKIPVADYVTHIAGTDLAPELVDHLRVEGEDYTRAEAKDYMTNHASEMQAHVERVMAENQVTDEFKKSTEVVKNNIKAQLDQVSHFDSAVNDAYATMVSSFYAVQAAQ